MAPFWNALYDHGAELLLNGHEHHYERVAPQGPSGRGRCGRPRQIVVGAGGAPLRPFGAAAAIGEVR